MDSGTVPRTLGALLLAVALAPAQLQTDVPSGYAQRYVDKLRGCNTNNGQSPLTAWKDLSYGYAQLAALSVPVPQPAVLHVAEGYYSDADGEIFPIEMREKHLIQGRNAFTTIVEGDVGDAAFRFPTGTDFLPTDGPYLSRLSIRNANEGVAIDSPGDEHVHAPLLHTLVIYACGVGIWGEQSAPVILDCTVTQNDTGIAKVVSVPEDCTVWTVRNTIAHDNGVIDMQNIGLTEAEYCNVDPTKCVYSVDDLTLLPLCPQPPICADGTAACGFNVDLPCGFINATPSTTALAHCVPNVPQGLPPAYDEYDLRLGSASALRGLGVATGVAMDGEGFGNPRVLPFPVSSTIPENADIGADEYDGLQVGPLIRRYEALAAVGPCAQQPVTSIPRCGVDAYRLDLRIDGEAGFTAVLALNDYSLFPSPPLAAPIILPSPNLGLGWLIPNNSLFVVARDATGSQITTNGSTAQSAPVPVNAHAAGLHTGALMPTPSFAQPPAPPANVQIAAAATYWQRATVQIVFVNSAGVVRLSNYQEYGLIF